MPTFSELFPGCQKLVTFPEPEIKSTRRHILSARARWAKWRAAGRPTKTTPERERQLALARQWIATGPHPFGALQRYAQEHRVARSTLYRHVQKLEAEAARSLNSQL